MSSGLSFHNDRNAFLPFTKTDCTDPLFNNQRGDPSKEQHNSLNITFLMEVESEVKFDIHILK